MMTYFEGGKTRRSNDLARIVAVLEVETEESAMEKEDPLKSEKPSPEGRDFVGDSDQDQPEGQEKCDIANEDGISDKSLGQSRF